MTDSPRPKEVTVQIEGATRAMSPWEVVVECERTGWLRELG